MAGEYPLSSPLPHLPHLRVGQPGWAYAVCTQVLRRESVSAHSYLQMRFQYADTGHPFTFGIVLTYHLGTQERVDTICRAFGVRAPPTNGLIRIEGRTAWVCREPMRRAVSIPGANTALSATKFSKEVPLAVQLMGERHPGNHQLRHYRIIMHEKYIYLPNGNPGVLTACNDLTYITRTKAYQGEQNTLPVPTCMGCRVFSDAYLEHPSNWEFKENRNQLKTLDYETHAAFLKTTGITYWEPNTSQLSSAVFTHPTQEQK